MIDNIGNRMKEYYEYIPRTKLMRRTPVIIRIDGRAFHTLTKGFERPVDLMLQKAMWETMLALCKDIQGCKLGYTQSDEISLLVTDYDNLNSDAWFGYEVQKMCSIAASSATLFFNKAFERLIVIENTVWDSETVEIKVPQYFNAHRKAIEKGAMFDARCFNIPKEEVTNYFYWRQIDAIRNSVQVLGRCNFSHKELQNKSCNEIKEMLHGKGINWDDMKSSAKNGSCAYYNIDDGKWVLDTDIPVFKNDGREYIERSFR